MRVRGTTFANPSYCASARSFSVSGAAFATVLSLVHVTLPAVYAERFYKVVLTSGGVRTQSAVIHTYAPIVVEITKDQLVGHG